MHQIWKSFRALYFASLMMLIGSGLLSTYLALRLARAGTGLVLGRYPGQGDLAPRRGRRRAQLDLS